MNGKFAFAVYATGDMHTKLKGNLVRGLRQHAPGIDIVDIDYDAAMGLMPKCPRGRFGEWHDSTFLRLAIPMLGQFQGYDKVAWVDSDIDIVSDGFSGLFQQETGEDGVGMLLSCSDAKHTSRLMKHVAGYDRGHYFADGLVLFDLRKIDREDWAKRLDGAFDTLLELGPGKLTYADMDMLNIMCRCSEVDTRYASPRWSRDARRPFAVHWFGAKGHRALSSAIDARSES